MKEPKFDYFKSFCEFSEKACQAADILSNTIHNFSIEKLPAQLDEIHTIEHQADEIKHKVIERLGREFVAPIEREDIVALVQEFDNVVDSIDEVMRKFAMFRIKEMRNDTKPFAELLVECCANLRDSTADFTDFRKSKTLRQKLIVINSDEAKADGLHFDAISTLFESNASPVSIVAWKSIYDALEDCFDNCEHTAEVMESVILKNT